MTEDVHTIYKNHEHVKFLLGPSNLLLLNYESFLYKRINGKFPKTTWKCVKGCPATVKTINGIFEKATPVTCHTHAIPIDEILVIETNMRIKHRVNSEFSLSPRQIHT